MKKLLIVEDEKMIRQGIESIARRSSVPIEEILLCKNGEEAYEIVKNNKIDVMITDIRMPKKDGITLVKEIQNLTHVPKVVVISGYDDFSYAVELLRYGAKEYLLKPIEREKINAILEKLEHQIEEEAKQVKDSAQIGIQQFKYMLLNPGITMEETYAIENEFNKYFVTGEYVVCCTNSKFWQMDPNSHIIILDDVNGQSVFLINAEIKEEVLSNLLKDYFVGVSRNHKSLRDLRTAYEEALYARKYAFATGNFITEYSKTETVKETVSSELIEQMVQLAGTDKIEEVNKFLIKILYKTKQGQIEPDYFMSIMNELVDKICNNYKNVLSFANEEIDNLKKVYGYDNASIYYETIHEWIEKINEKLLSEYDDYKNKQKIQRAIGYIQENYARDLNMAVVSNYISMNYSLFSYVFKQFTGMNFVNYLKDIRMKEAKRLLEETDKKIIEISNAIGYENEKHFMKIFKSTTGVSPTEFRKNAQVGRQNTIC
ncbi:MAG: two component transcriptional regulator, AraC family [Anaerocolumna sp.]|jgi:YesN/AraC family two-component response regulator|nr:two component transcriptional regulator, AraC family [Anaerocolumna sp.]